MKKSNIIKVLFTSVLAMGAGIIAGPASADPAGLTPGSSISSDAMLLASLDFKGIHPSEPHVVYERHQSEKDQFARGESKPDAVPVMFSGKPPYNRHTVKKHELEKVQFARLEEQAEVTKHEHNIYHGALGIRPPYKRNW